MIWIGIIIALVIKLFGHILSGVLFFSSKAWDGCGAWGYRLIYNDTSIIPEEIITIIILMFIPLKTLKQQKNIVSNNPIAINHPFYGNWIKGYSSDAYHDTNIIIMDTLDQLTKDYTEKQLEHLKDIFINCPRYEMAFWDLS